MIFENNLSSILLSVGPVEVRWYGVLFATGVGLNYLILRWLFKREGHKEATLESLALYLFLGLLIGARLGEVIFYNPVYYWQHPLEILQVWNGGLASHGAAIGMFLAYLLWCKLKREKFSKFVDLLALPMPLTAAFVRIGNFFNSEIVGTPIGWDPVTRTATDLSTFHGIGVVFKQLGEDFPRHPSQLYEAALCLVVFAVLMWFYLKKYKTAPKLSVLMLFIFLYFGGRFVLEFWKDLHVFPDSFPLTMGQVLSTIPVLIAVAFFVRWRMRANKA